MGPGRRVVGEVGRAVAPLGRAELERWETHFCQAQLVLPSPSLPTREVTPLMERGREFVHGLNPVR